MKYKFIDIGCGHTNVSTDIYGLDVNGLLVEPIKEFCDVLPNSDTVLIEQSAIGEYDGTIDIHCDLMDWGKIKYYSIQQLSSVKHIERIAQKNPIHGITSIIHNTGNKRSVNLMTFESLINKYNITEVDQIKIDVEGYENVLLQQLIELMRSNKLIVNKTIIFEYNHMSDLNELDKLKILISNEFGFNYRFEKLGWNEDIIMEKI